MFVADWNKGVVCFDGTGTYMSTITDTDIRGARGVCVDGSGNLMVTGVWSHNVVQYTEEGKKLGEIAGRGDGLYSPYSVCYHQTQKKMFVTMSNKDVVKMYELK